MAAALKGTGLRIPCLGSPYGRDFYIEDEAAQARHEQLLARVIEFAATLEAPFIRIFALWKPDHANYLLRPDFGECLGRLVERLTPSVRMAEKAGVVLAVETEGDSYVGQVQEARQLIGAFNSPNLRLCWDVVNGWRCGENPWPVGYAHARGLYCHVHVKDRLLNPESPHLAGNQTAVGTGVVPWTYILNALKADGYDGWFSTERHYPPATRVEEKPELREPVIADVRGLQALIAQVGGR